TSLRSELAELNRTRARLGTQIASRQEYLLRARSLRHTNPAPVEFLLRPLSSEARRLQEALTASEARVREFKATRGMTDLHPEIVAEHKLQDRYRRQFAELADPRPPLAPAEAPEADEALAGPVPVDWNPVVAQVQMELRALVEQQEQNATDMAATKSRTAALLQMQSEVFDRRQEMARVHEQFERAQKEFDTYQQLVAQCDQALTVEIENRGILFTDVVPVEGSAVPVSPLAKTVLLLSIMAGLVTGAVFVVLAELFDRRYRTSAQVIRALKLPILEGIEEIVTATERRAGFLRRALLVPAVAAALLGMVGLSGGLSYLSLNHPNTYVNVMSYPKSAWASVAGPAAPAQLPPARTTED
ncbi:MAG: hypothetical protein GY778_14795, partial [bacterium]|nr:hypothetical protein [bacterium]